MKRIISVLLSLVLLITFSAGALAAAKFNTPVHRQINYVAMGDSIAKGVLGGQPSTYVSGSDQGYTDVLKAKLESIHRLGTCDLENFTMSGMTSADLAAASPQFIYSQEIKTANVITLTIGANDLLQPLYAYLSSVPSNSTPEQITQGFVTTVLPQIQADIAQGKCKQIQNNILTILMNIRKANPKARVYVMGYFDPFPSLKRTNGVSMTPLVAALNINILAAVAKAKLKGALVGYVDTYAVMAIRPDVYLAPMDIHPTEAGYRAIANLFWKQMRYSL